MNIRLLMMQVTITIYVILLIGCTVKINKDCVPIKNLPDFPKLQGENPEEDLKRLITNYVIIIENQKRNY